MKRIKLLSLAFVAMLISGVCFAQESVVYFTKEVSPEALVNIYKAYPAITGNVGVKINTGEPDGQNYLKPELIDGFVNEACGTIVDCNSIFPGRRTTGNDHLKVTREHGYNKVSNVDILDAIGSRGIRVQTEYKHLGNQFLAGHNSHNYDYMFILTHFCGNELFGFEGAISNTSFGYSSREGKAVIVTAGKSTDPETALDNKAPQNDILETLAEGAHAVAKSYEGQIYYFTVLNNISVDSDYMQNPAAPSINDIGIVASTDPVALDQACLDLLAKAKGKGKATLLKNIKNLNGEYTLEYAEKLGLGSRNYKLVELK